MYSLTAFRIVKLNIVVEGNIHKFTVSKNAAELREWGIGFAKCKAEANRDAWGHNLLGVALQEVRRLLAKTEG
jgi:predicted NAD-dependent protein-ADP-ribosyltransferase YbiA (DUF1768 family)